MATFTKKIHSVRFTNETHDTIEIVHNQGTKKKPHLVTMFIEVDFDHPDFMALEKDGWDLERIQESTLKYNQAQGEAWREIVKWHAAEEVMKIKEDFNKRVDNMKEEVVQTSEILKAVLRANEDEEIIFKAKLSIFELDEVKSLKDRNLKMSIRKSKTMLELLSQLNEIHKLKD